MKIEHIVSAHDKCWHKETNIVIQESAKQKAPDRGCLRLTGIKKQTFLGFGGCFNELGWEALNQISATQREQFLDELFDEDKCNFSYGRVPIGANDFSKQWYSCDEVEGDTALIHFNIERDKVHTIPFVREAIKRQSNFNLFASPWSPPIWMKTKKAYNYGRLRMEPDILQAYAKYFVKFVEAYKQEGIEISQVHVQNEPMADQKFPSCLWSGEDMRDFIKGYLGPAFEKSELETEIWLGTINGPFVDFMMNGGSKFDEFYDQFANTILSDEEAYKYISGVGLQWGGKHVMQQIRASYPELHYMNTESECGDGENTWEHMEYIFNQMWFYIQNGAERYTYWNLALQEGGISTWGWSQNSLATVEPLTGTLTRQPEFYLMKHFSHFIKRGAHLLQTTGYFTSNTLAFENPDGSLVLVVGNSMNQERMFAFEHQGESFSAKLLPHTIHTFYISFC